MNKHFHKIRIVALLLVLLSFTLGWYVLILMTNPKDDWSIDKSQYIGLIITLLIAFFVWLKNCYTIRVK